VAKEEGLYTLLRGIESSQLKGAVDDSLKFLKSFAGQDDGVFESRGTRLLHADRRRESAHVTRAATVLYWHLREGTTGRWHRRELLARLLNAVGLLRYRDGGDPLEQVNRRLGRVEGDYYQKFEIPLARTTFHDVHRALAGTLNDRALARCGTACPPAVDDPRAQYYDKLFIESFQAAPGITVDEQQGDIMTPDASQESPSGPTTASSLDEKASFLRPGAPRAADNQPDGSISPKLPEEQWDR
jgi:hypothetical protein